MPDVKVAIINASSVLTDDQVDVAVPALQMQVERDFAPAWGVSADLQFFSAGDAGRIPAGYWWLVILDYSDQADALGYHDVTVDGMPLGKVFAASDLDARLAWTVTASHELLEMLGDPAINLTAFVQSSFDPNQNSIGRAYAYEVCDPCEADADGYLIDGTLVSDFVYPAWFEPFRAPGTRFDHRDLIKAALELRPLGYMMVYDLTTGTGWQQVAREGEDRARYGARAAVGSRRERRGTPRNRWMPSRRR